MNNPTGQKLTKVILELDSPSSSPNLVLEFESHRERWTFSGLTYASRDRVINIAIALQRDIGQVVTIFDKSATGQAVTIAFANGSIQKFGDLSELAF